MEQHENCHVDPVEKPLDRDALSGAMAAFLAVYGMGCPRCATRVRNGLLNLDGVLLVEVHLERGIAAAAYDPQCVTPQDLIAAVSSAGNDGRHHYRAELIQEMPASQALQG